MEKEKEKLLVDEKIDENFKELLIDEEEWIRIQTTGGGAET